MIATVEPQAHPAAAMFPMMAEHDYEVLRDDIAANGLIEPIWMHPDGRVIDGRNRLRACQETGVEPHFRTWTGEGSLTQFVASLNMHRRHLTSSQRAAIAVEILPALEAEAKERQGKRTDLTSVKKLTEVEPQRATDRAAEIVGTNRQYVSDAKKIKETRPEDFELIKAGKITIKDAKKILKKDTAKRENEERIRLAKIELAKPSPHDNILHGDFRRVAKDIDAESVSLIFTDPPYDTKSIPLYDDLAEVADRVLVDGGSLITFLGAYATPRVIESLSTRLKFFWPLACIHTGRSSRMDCFGIVVKWKPMLWFVKGKNRLDVETFVDDAVVSEQQKSHHPWQQSTIEAEYYIEKLTRPNDLVFDPFCGGGTTAVAAKKLHRRWITCDTNETHVVNSRQRIAETILCDADGKDATMNTRTTTRTLPLPGRREGGPGDG